MVVAYVKFDEHGYRDKKYKEIGDDVQDAVG